VAKSFQYVAQGDVVQTDGWLVPKPLMKELVPYLDGFFRRRGIDVPQEKPAVALEGELGEK
jgi:hypothetical protein